MEQRTILIRIKENIKRNGIRLREEIHSTRAVEVQRMRGGGRWRRKAEEEYKGRTDNNSPAGTNKSVRVATLLQ